MIELSLETDIENLPQLIFGINRSAVTQAARSAMNKAAVQSRTQASKMTRETYRLKAAYVNERLRVIRAKGNKLSNLQADLRVSAQPISLIRFAPNLQPVKQKGIPVAARKRLRPIAIGPGKRATLPRAFVARAKGTQGTGESLQIFSRAKGRTSTGSAKLKKRSVPSIKALLTKQKKLEALGQFAGKRHAEIFRHEFNFYLNRIKLKG